MFSFISFKVMSFAFAFAFALMFSFFGTSKTTLAALAPLQAVLFDIDGTICDSDPLHHYAFREMLQEVHFLSLPYLEERERECVCVS